MRCLKCNRPIQNCLCHFIKECDTGIKFIFLMHPKEAKKQRTGTGVLSHLCLKDSKIFVGVDFNFNEEILELLNTSNNNVDNYSNYNNKKYLPLLLFPSDNAVNISDEGLQKRLVHYGNNKTLDTQYNLNNLSTKLNDSNREYLQMGLTPLVIILDGTWSGARKIFNTNANIFNGIQKLSFIGEYSTLYTFKREPKPTYISTIESCFYLIKEFQSKGVAKNCDVSCLMTVFKALVKGQLVAQNERIAGLRPSTFPQNWKYTTPKVIPDYL